MHMPKHLTSLLFLHFLLHTGISAQTQGLTLLGTGGGMARTGDLFLSYSFGEPCILTSQSADRILTEGYQQPGSMSLMVRTDHPDNLQDIMIFPNPAKDHITLSGLASSGCYEARLFNLAGQLVHSQKLNGADVQRIKLDPVKPGWYVLTILFETGRSVSQSIIKS